MGTRTITYTGSLVVTSCWCGIQLAIPNDLYDFAKRKGQNVYCPLGHSFVYGDTKYKQLEREAEEARAQLARERARRDQAEAEAEHQKARARGYKGAMVQTKKRAAKGVCPVPGCRRHFVDVQRHVESKHPGWDGAE